jgi:hypothetical protein
MSNDNSGAIYQFRCAPFILLDCPVSDSYKKGTKFDFEVTDDNSAPLTKLLIPAMK